MVRHKGNIFELESYRGVGIREVSAVMVTFITLSLLSGIAAVCIIANFNEVTARIAIIVANALTSGVPMLIILIAFIYFVVRLRFKWHRRFWRW